MPHGTRPSKAVAEAVLIHACARSSHARPHRTTRDRSRRITMGADALAGTAGQRPEKAMGPAPQRGADPILLPTILGAAPGPDPWRSAGLSIRKILGTLTFSTAVPIATAEQVNLTSHVLTICYDCIASAAWASSSLALPALEDQRTGA